MYIHFTLGAIFIVFILCVHCDNAGTNNEILEIYVPSSPQNLTANKVTADEIHLLWTPPATYTIHLRTNPVDSNLDRQTLKPEPDLTVIAKKETQADEPITEEVKDDFKIDIPLQESLKDDDYTYNSYKGDKQKYSEDFSDDDTYRSKRDVRSHRHRKRRQDNANDTKINLERNMDRVETHQAFELPIEVVKKSLAMPSRKDITQIAFVLYYEEGVAMKKATTDSIITTVQTSEEIKQRNVFRSDLGIQDNYNATKNLTLLNTSGVQTKVVGFRLRNLKPFTPYKIWVRAFYNFPLAGVMSSDLLSRLGPQSDSLYVLTDVNPPSAPIILNLTCDQPNGILYLQWRQPLEYNNSLDQYVVTLRKIPEQQPRTRLTLLTKKEDIETMISVKVELSNATMYEVKIYAVTLSVARPNSLINGSESPPKEVVSDACSSLAAARAPAGGEARAPPGSLLALAAALLAVLAAGGAAAVYWRCRSRVSKCISAAYNYLEEGGERGGRAPLNINKKPVVNHSPVVSCSAGGGASSRPPRMSGPAHPTVRARHFPAHVAALHADGDIGFSKEYEIVVSMSAALGHTSHHSYRPENRLKNRYLNITAYDHSRVCVSAGGRCGAAGCVGAGRGAACDYVNANFIDGMLPALAPAALRRLERRLERRARPARQPSVKATKPPPNLAEGIESAFLNIEFSGIVESEEQADSDSDRSDDESELDDVYVDINGIPRQIKLEWVVWRRRYIATQGPTPATLDAFWRMIWQHRVCTLVMITNLVERGRRKCDMYWPAGGRGSAAEFGGIHVTLLYEDVRAAYTVRHLRVRNTTAGSESGSESSTPSNEGRHIVQYHYTVWPDHGTPRHPLAVLPFVRAAADPATVLVHCSAGVGRTGTYIVIDAQLNQLKLTGTLSPLGFLCRARTQRNHLVQTEEQYVFVHDALLEYVRSGNTEVEFTKAREYLVKLLEPISEEELAVMDLNPIKHKSVNDLNGDNDMSSVKSVECSENIVENGSQVSIKTDELNSESKSSMDNQEKDGLVNGDESEGVYDLAPRSTDTYSKKMAAYNNMNEQEKEEMRRVNRAENYALLERMRSLSNRHQVYQGPPPVNLLEKQNQLITRSCVEASVCARAPHNADKNRPGGILPSDSARVMLVPKPGVEGSEYINASWVSGVRRVREYAVCQHSSAPEPWRLLWDHTAQLVLLLHDPDEPDCDVFWPTEDEKELFVANFRASFVSKEVYVAQRRSERTNHTETPVVTATTPEINGYRRQEGSECADDERLIPDNNSPVNDTVPEYRFDRTELRLERLSNRDLSARKSIANGDLFSSLSEKKNGPKSPRSPSKMSLKNFKLSSPTKFKFPEWGSRTAGSPPDTAPPPPPITPSLTVEEEAELRRPVYTFEKVQNIPNVPTDRIIEVTNVSVHSLQDDYQLSVKFIKCSGWLKGDTTAYSTGRPDDNEYVRAVRQSCGSEKEDAIDRLIAPYQDSFALIEFVAGCQMEYKNGPVVVVDKYGGWRALTFCSLSAACGGVRNPNITEPGSEWASPCSAADLYCSSALNAHARCQASPPSPASLPSQGSQASGSLSEADRPMTHTADGLLAAYCALTAYVMKLPRPDS